MITVGDVQVLQVRFDNKEDLRQVTPWKLSDLSTHITGTAYWKANWKSKKNSYIVQITEEDLDGEDPVTYKLPIEYTVSTTGGMA